MRAPPPMFECLIPCFVISRRGPAFRQSVVIKVTPKAFVLMKRSTYVLRCNAEFRGYSARGGPGALVVPGGRWRGGDVTPPWAALAAAVTPRRQL